MGLRESLKSFARVCGVIANYGELVAVRIIAIGPLKPGTDHSEGQGAAPFKLSSGYTQSFDDL